MDVDGQRYFNDPLGMIGADQRRQLERLHPDAVWAAKPIVCNGLREIKVYSDLQHTKRDIPVHPEENDDEAEQITSE